LLTEQDVESIEGLNTGLLNKQSMFHEFPSRAGGFPPGAPVSSHTNANIGANEHD